MHAQSEYPINFSITATALKWGQFFIGLLRHGAHCLRSEKKFHFEIFFFHFLPNKTCNFWAAQLKCYWLIGMKIMKFIHCYWTQWCATFISWVLLAPSSVEIFNFWTRRAWRLIFSQNDVLMSASFCENFTLQAFLVQKLKISTLDGAKSTQDIKVAHH